MAHSRRGPEPRDVAERFWSKVDRRGEQEACWLWTGRKNEFGYGLFDARKPPLRAHRVAWALASGTIPAGLWVLHNCPGGDNPACVNPAHLWLGDHDANMADMMAKGRGARGERSGNARLTGGDILAIRQEYVSGGIFQRELASRFGVKQSTVSRVLSGNTWTHSERTGAPGQTLQRRKVR